MRTTYMIECAHLLVVVLVHCDCRLGLDSELRLTVLLTLLH